MAIVQEAFDIPSDIMTKIITGEYRRIGGVVRYAFGPKKGQIVKHLDPIDLDNAQKAKGIVARALQFAKENKNGLVVAGIVAGVALAGGAVYLKLKGREPIVVSEFRETLRTYLEAIREGNLELNNIEKLILALDELKKDKDFDKYEIKLSTEDIDVLIGRIYNYTIHLAENNHIVLTDDKLKMTDNSIINLQNYLRTQKYIFEVVA